MEDTFDVNKLNKVVTEKVKNGENIDETGFGKFIDNVANYLLESSDIESGRKIEDTFYRNEKQYRSSYAMGKNTIASNELVEYQLNEDTLTDNLSDEKGYIMRLFNVDNLDKTTIKRLIMNIGKKSEIHNETLLSALSWFEDELKLILNDKELEFINLFKNGDSIATIATEIGRTRQTVNKKLNNICEKCVIALGKN